MPDLLSFTWFRWTTSGYRAITKAPPQLSSAFATIGHGAGAEPTTLIVPVLPVGRWQRLERIRPLEKNAAIFYELADAKPTPAGAWQFSNRYGLLTPGDQMPLDTFTSAVRGIRETVRFWRKGDNKAFVEAWNHAATRRRGGLASITPKLVYRDDGPPALALEPATLLDAIWMQFAQVVTGGLKLQQCAWCDQWFRYGEGPGKKASAVYCGTPCRQAAYRERKAKALDRPKENVRQDAT